MYIKIRAKTGQRVEELIKENDDHFVVSVKEKALKNMANKRILELMKQYFKTNNIRIISGHHSQHKLLSVD